MACVGIALWTWAAAIAALEHLPGWALVCAAIGGCAIGIQLTICFDSDLPLDHRAVRPARVRRLEVVRRPSRLAGVPSSGDARPMPSKRPALHEPA